MLERIGPLPADAVIIDLGCSTGYLLEDLAPSTPMRCSIGVDLVAAGLRKAHANVTGARSCCRRTRARCRWRTRAWTRR